MCNSLSELFVKNPFTGAPVLYTELTDSTMILARRVKPVHGTVVMAGFQSAGRGRLPGRQWISERNKNLMFTLVLDKGKTPSGRIPLPLITGLGLALYMERSHSLTPFIKWPNDILVSGKKISGIVVEQGLRFYFVGVGVNLNQRSFPEEIDFKTTSVLRETEVSCVMEEELVSVLAGIKSALSIGDPAFEIEKRLFSLGEEVVFISGDPAANERIKGVLEGISPDGTIRIKLDNGGLVSSASGEIEYALQS